MSEIGTRVGALMSTDEKRAYLFGYGVYVGDEIPDGDSTGIFSELARMSGRTVPKIELDNGKVVWGSECWWGPEGEVKQRIGDREVVEVDIDEKREE